MRTTRKMMKRFYLNQAMAAWLIFYLCLLMPAQVVTAATPVCTNPGGATVIQGANTTTVTVNQSETIMQWSNFNTVDDELVAFQQGSLVNSAVLNRISGGQTQFDGDLTGQGMRIFLINPAGIVFGSTATINVSQLVASSLDIANNDFLNGAPYTFTGGATAGDVKNQGSIEAESVALIGKYVQNTGTILSDKYIAMAAGNSIILSEAGGNVAVQVILDQQLPGDFVVEHSNGEIHAQHIVLAAGDVWSWAYIDAEGDGSASVTMDAQGDIGIYDDIEVEAQPGSPAVATLDLTAGGDIEIMDEVWVAAFGGEADDATAQINVNADGSVLISGIEGEAGLVAEASGMNTNTAEITINAGQDVEVNAEYSGNAFIYAGTYDGTTNNSSVDITAGGNIIVDAYDGSFAGVEAHSYAYYHPEMPAAGTAGVTMDAGKNVFARAEDDSLANIDSQAWGGTTNVANTTVTAGEAVEVQAEYYSESAVRAEARGAIESNTAAVDITVTGVENSENYRNGDLYVNADSESYAEILALADMAYPEQMIASPDRMIEPTAVNTANLNVNAAADVEVAADGEYSSAYLHADAYHGVSNTAATDVTAGGSVIVLASGYTTDAFLGSNARGGIDNSAAVNVEAGGGVMVFAGMGSEGNSYSSAEIGAYAEEAISGNTAAVDITGNQVSVMAMNEADAGITAMAAYIYPEQPLPSLDAPDPEIQIGADGANTASVTINVFKIDIEDLVIIDSAPAETSTVTAVNGYAAPGTVVANASDGGAAWIQAIADGGKMSTSVNTSDVLICAEGYVTAMANSYEEDWTSADISAQSRSGYENNSSLGIGAQEGLRVMADGYGAVASIASTASYAMDTNNAELIACTASSADVRAFNGANAAIETAAVNALNNNASTAVCADGLVLVRAAYNGNAAIKSEAGMEIDGPAFITALENEHEPTTANAETIVVSQNSGVAVAAEYGGYAEISSSASAFYSDAYTGVCAQDHVIVEAGFGSESSPIVRLADNGYFGSGGTAVISSEAGFMNYARDMVAMEEIIIQQEPPGLPPIANAETSVVSHEGSVSVVDLTGYRIGQSAIRAGAFSDGINTAYTGVAAGADLASVPAFEGPDIPMLNWNLDIENLRELYPDALSQGHVSVYAAGPYSSAEISSAALNGYDNTADTVVCAPGSVRVQSYGEGYADINSWAYGDEYNTALTQVYANEVFVNLDIAYGGIGASGYDWVGIDDEMETGSGNPVDGGWEWTAGEDVAVLKEGETETLIIDSYANKQDCPDCPPCPDCPCQDDDEPIAPVAPLAQFDNPRIEGCPALVQAAAIELGTPGDAIQVAINNALALNPNIQPCQACAGLISAANILKDADGSRMAAMAYVFNQVAPADAPFTPEMAAAVATAFAENAETDPRYASAMEYVDAFARYITVVDQQLGAPVGDGDSVAFVMNKYGNTLAESGNSNMAAYVMMQLQQ